MGIDHKGVEYGPGIEFAGQILQPRVRIFNDTGVPIIVRPRDPERGLSAGSVGQFAIIIDAPDLGCPIHIPVLVCRSARSNVLLKPDRRGKCPDNGSNE
ncbi:MAG: hypothetical protein RQM92_05090 [Candidatus Syntrophopropionicum ammoniitolerans]